ncbi:MAG TPA: hypothetical protein VGR26_18340 [Acidimicrobiales bacterium]|nr:hypothetical protein [Acidimicrobiales bacterium]
MSQEAPVPFDVAAALHFHSQAQFHLARYLSGLAARPPIPPGRRTWATMSC